MSFSDHPPLPPFMPPPFPNGDLSGFWNQNGVENDDAESHSHFDQVQSFKRPRNSLNNNNNNSSNPPNFRPINPRTNPSDPPPNRGTSNIFYKTRMCLKFLDGNCRNGDNCTFAHGADDLREPPPNWQEIVGKKETGSWNDEQRNNVHRFKICKKYANGEDCPYGENCTFIHKRAASSYDAEVEGPRESSAISIGTNGTMMGGNRSGSDQIDVLNLNNNKNVINPPSDAVRVNTFWKTKICSKWEITGQCPFGERCHFAHGQADLQVPGTHSEAEAVNVIVSATTPKLAPLTDISKTVLAPPTRDNGVKKLFQKWKGPKKINNIYADWIDDMSPPLTYPNNIENNN